ncbi:MAG: methyltransferase domain-containing protein [Candidatus Eremiobacterota bacterium]
MRFGVRLLTWLEPHLDRLYGARKRILFAGLRGRVLEIGAGTGINRGYLPPEVEWLPLEPEVDLHESIRRRQPGVEVLTAPAEALPLPDASVDGVICSLVLCSVTDPERALREARRVLRPGGCLVFLEHVAARPGTWLACLQRWIQPGWTWLTGGCHPDRRTEQTLHRAGFQRVELERFRTGLPIVSPHIVGRAWKGDR